MKTFLRLTAAAGFMLSASAVWADTVKIGLLAPFSGPFAVWGTQFKQAVEAFQKVNGDPNGHKLEIIYRDNAGDPTKTRQLAEEMILREKVSFLTGFSLTPEALAVSELITDAKIPAVIMNSGTAIITRKSPYFVRTSFTVNMFAAPIPAWMEKEKIKSIYILVSDYAPGHDLEAEMKAGAAKIGAKVVGAERIPLSTTDYAPYMERAAQANPELVYIFMPAGAPSIAIIREFAKRGLKAKGIKLAGSGEIQEIFLPAIGDDVIGTISGFHYTETNTNPKNIVLRKTLVDMFGPNTVPDAGTVGAWDAMQLMYDAVKEIGPKVTGDQFIAFAKGRKWDSPRGPIMIDPVERDIIQNMYLRRVEKRDGKLVNVDIMTVPEVRDPWKIANPNAK